MNMSMSMFMSYKDLDVTNMVTINFITPRTSLPRYVFSPLAEGKKERKKKLSLATVTP